MTPDDAAWVRDHAWTTTMRATYGPRAHRCACQQSLTECMDGAHDHCPLRQPHHGRSHETWVLDTDGHPVATPRGRAHGRPAAQAQVWVTGCCATWRCHCTCHTTPRPGQLALDLETA